ncbi:hypothetical protein EPUS_00338 [Endocarpon pusillum Z07020]|uniref:Uncharacterized protein n=1 Tax=Endocarpon pusillum (strain Z07020 / HMAS-L-300199) TaxID=1263415 RepID=U1GEL6_ENDPU|nr:uncharacterized protein EPUS_00338 [Endocarpon pusillum Z07020]ERF70151.1 hypothetical protein EPUS_00338 [Endocarpon pusillum Z07020]
MSLARSSFQSRELIQRWLLDIPRGVEDSTDQNHEQDGNAQREQRREISTATAKARFEGRTPSRGNNSNTPHCSALYRTSRSTKDNRKSSAWREDDESSGRNQTHIGNSKRRRSTSVHRQDNEKRKRRKAVKECPSISRNTSVRPSSPASSLGSSEALPLRRDTLERRGIRVEQYERRPRHKTKANKYDLKMRAKSREARDIAGGDRKSNRRRRRKSGLTLNSDFKAPNVVQERLTLKANSGPGMFHRGKASSPVHIRGMPDLCFTEMNFLSKRRDHQEPNKRDPRQARSSKSKEKEKSRAEQISEYFQRSQAAKPCIGTTAQTMVPEQNMTQDSPAVSVLSTSDHQDLDLDRRQWTPASHGLSRHTAQQMDRDAAVTQGCRISDIEEPQTEHHRRHSSPITNRDQLKSSSSYYSWSATPSRQCRSYQEATTNSPKVLAQTSHPDGFRVTTKQQHAVYSRPVKSPHDQIVREPVHESPMSQLSLDEYTKSMLLGSKQHLWGKFPTNYRAAELYTLTDLKGLSRLGKLEEPGKDGHGLQGEDEQREWFLSNNGFRFDTELSNTPTAHMPTTQKRSSMMVGNASSNDQHLSPHIKLPIAGSMTNGHSAGQIFDGDMLVNRFSMPGLSFAPSGSRNRPTSEQSYGDPSFENIHAKIPARTIRSVTATQPGPHEYRWTNTYGRLPQDAPAKDTAQQIIRDIEQEELLISQAKNHKSGAVEDVIDIALDGFSDHTSQKDLREFHDLRDHDPFPLQQDSEYSEPNIHRLPPGPAMAQPVPSPHQSCLDPGRMNADRSQDQRLAKNVRFATDQQSGCLSLSVNDESGLAEQQRQQEGENALENFWRPNILY